MRLFKISLVLSTFIIVSCNQSKSIAPNTNFKLEFYGDGNIKSFKKYNDSTHMTQTIWFDGNGNIKSIQKSIDTVAEGQSIWFYPNGNIQNLVIFKKGKAYGNAFVFYEDGALQNRRFWENDKLIGYSTNYYDDSIGLIRDIYRYDDSGKLMGVKKAAFPGAHPQLVSIDSLKNK